jgi:subtilisin family serine protease
MTRNKFYVIITLVLFSVACSKKKVTNADLLDGSQVSQQAPANYVPNELMVKFKPGYSEEAKTVILARINGKITEHVVTKMMERVGDKEGFYVVSTPMDVVEAIAKLKGMEIEYAEPNFTYASDAVSNETYYNNGSLWGMYGDATLPANQYGSQAGEAWAANKTGSSNVYIGVIDEGAYWNHDDLINNSWTNPYDLVDGIDNDGNGYKDDVHGWDFVTNNNTVFDGLDDDHGSHVSGTIGAQGGNGIGVAGVTWDVTMIYCKFLGKTSGTTANAIKAVDYISDLKIRHNLDLPATNNSWGGGGYSSGLLAAINRANTAEILFVNAAGNASSNNDAVLDYPSCYNSPNIISVASITKSGGLSSFSNYGATMVDLGAPGSEILSTVPKRNGKGVVPGYSTYSGTSMATPHVTGACALYESLHPGSTAAQIKNAVMTQTVATGSLSGKCVSGGRLDVSGY